MTNRSQKSRQRTAICHFSFVIGHWSFGKSFSAVSAVVRKNRSAGVSPASEPRQLLLGQHDLCRLEAGDTFFLTTTEYTGRHTRNQTKVLRVFFAPSRSKSSPGFTAKPRRAPRARRFRAEKSFSA